MVKSIFPFLFFISATAFAITPCEEQLGGMLDNYKRMGMPVESYKIKDCSSLTSHMDAVFDENTNTDAPEVSSSSACSVLFSFGESRLPELMVVDKKNNFEVKRSFNSQDHRLDLSLYGDHDRGTILFIDLQGNNGGIDYVTRANYDMGNDLLRLVKWKVGWFFNSYSHDYTLQCRDL